MLFAQRSTLPAPDRAVVNGEWRYEPTWPAERLRPEGWPLADATANRPGDGPDELDVRGDVGWTAWISCAGVLPWGQPDDQRPDELYSLTYTWAPLERELEILGHARLRVRVASSAPVAYLSAKLCDVFPDGTSSLVARGMLNLTHRDSREQPSPLHARRAVDVELEIEATSWTFEPGHACGSTSPAPTGRTRGRRPRPVTLTIDRAVDDARAARDRRPRPIDERPVLPPPHVSDPDRGRRRRRRPGWPAFVGRSRTTRSRASRRRTPAARSRRRRRARAVRCGATTTASCRSRRSTRARRRRTGEAEFEMRWPEATVTSRADVTIESDADAYRATIDLVVHEDGEERFRRRWETDDPAGPRRSGPLSADGCRRTDPGNTKPRRAGRGSVLMGYPDAYGTRCAPTRQARPAAVTERSRIAALRLSRSPGAPDRAAPPRGCRAACRPVPASSSRS